MEDNFKVKWGVLHKLPNEKFSFCVFEVLNILNEQKYADAGFTSAIENLVSKQNILDVIKTNSRKHNLTKKISDKSKERYKSFMAIKLAVKAGLHSYKMSVLRNSIVLKEWIDLYDDLLDSSKAHDMTKGILNLKKDRDKNMEIAEALDELELSEDFERLCSINDSIWPMFGVRSDDRKDNKSLLSKQRKEIVDDIKSLIFSLMSLARLESSEESVYAKLCVRINTRFEDFDESNTKRINANNRKKEKNENPIPSQTGDEAQTPASVSELGEHLPIESDIQHVQHS